MSTPDPRPACGRRACPLVCWVIGVDGHAPAHATDAVLVPPEVADDSGQSTTAHHGADLTWPGSSVRTRSARAGPSRSAGGVAGHRAECAAAELAERGAGSCSARGWGR